MQRPFQTQNRVGAQGRIWTCRADSVLGQRIRSVCFSTTRATPKSYQGRAYTCIARGVLSFPAGMFTPYCCRRSPKHGDLTGPACLDDLKFLVDPPGVEPAHPQHRFCLPIGCGGFPPSVYTHLISELSAYCVGLRQARAFTSPKFWAAATSGFQHQAAAPHQALARYTDAQ